MKKLLLLGAMVCALGMMTACKNGTLNEPDKDTTVACTTTKTDTWSDEWERLAKKMCGNDTLLPEEWSFFFENIDKADGGYSEDMGYCLYKSLQYPRFIENMEQEGLAKLSSERREQVLGRMMSMMSIDLMAEKHTYTWAEFSNNFYIFKGSKAAKREF